MSEKLQPWSTFVLKTKLLPDVLERMLEITDDIVENDAPAKIGAGEMEEQFLITLDRLRQEGLLEYFEEEAKKYVIEAFCQSMPFNKEEIRNEDWLTQISRMWINSQKDNEFFPLHKHTRCAMSSVMYLKIPEQLPPRNEDNGCLLYTSPSPRD